MSAYIATPPNAMQVQMTKKDRVTKLKKLYIKRTRKMSEAAAQAELADMLGASPITVSQWLLPSGIRPIPARKLAVVQRQWAE